MAKDALLYVSILAVSLLKRFWFLSLSIEGNSGRRERIAQVTDS
jgi:hypothetical protein